MDGIVSIKGYHKTRIDRATKIISFKSFPISRGQDKWLGDGIYFWDNLDDAIWWNQKDYLDGAILSAQLNCSLACFMDLDQPGNMGKLKAYAKWLVDCSDETETPIDLSDKNIARAMFCTMYKEAYEIQLMRYTFHWLEYNIAGFREVRGRTQYCATDMQIISNIVLEAKSIGGRMIGVSNGYIYV